MIDHMLTTLQNTAWYERDGLRDTFRRFIGLPPLEEPEVVRVGGRIVCDACGKEYRDHPQDPVFPWPTFVLLCNGTHAKC